VNHKLNRNERYCNNEKKYYIIERINVEHRVIERIKHYFQLLFIYILKCPHAGPDANPVIPCARSLKYQAVDKHEYLTKTN